MNKQGKVWGYTIEIFNKNNVSVNRLSINKGSCCSKHLHNYKYNTFYIESGKVLIQEWKNDYNLVDETVLTKGEMCAISPNTYHRFIGLENSIMYEIYHTELSSADIVREDTGRLQY